MSETVSGKVKVRLRVAVISTGVALLLALVLLIRAGDYLFTVFTVIAPLLLLVAIVMLGWSIFDELRAKKVI